MKWEIKKLGELCEIVNGSTPLRTNKDFWENGNFPWFTIDDIRTQGRVITATKQKVTEAALSKLKVLPIDTVLLCCTASVGEYAITKIELTTNQQFNGLVVKDKDQLHPEFLMYYCSALKDRLLELSGKTTIDFIAISKIKNLNIPLPPLSEQKRIVAILDQAFEVIAKAKENTEQNLKNTKEIFESYLQLALSPSKSDALSPSKSDALSPSKSDALSPSKSDALSPSKGEVFDGSASSPTNKGDALSSSKCDALSLSKWEEKKLGEVCEFQRGLTYSKKDEVDYSENIVLRSNNVDLLKNKLVFSELKYINPLVEVPHNKRVKKGSLLICTANGSKKHLGKVAHIDDNYNYAFGGFMGLITPISVLDSKFLFYLMITDVYKKFIDRLSDGANINNLKFNDLSNFLVPLPPLSEQKTIVRQLDALRAETQKLEAIYTQKLSDLEELKKSLLQKAFAGELVK